MSKLVFVGEFKGKTRGGEQVSVRVHRKGRAYWMAGPTGTELAHPSVGLCFTIEREIEIVYQIIDVQRV